MESASPTPSDGAPGASGRIYGLDLVRAVAIALVVVGHGVLILPDPTPYEVLFDFGGFFGVELFFVLSGLLIGRILIRTLERDGPSVPRLATFWLRRWFRTLPAFYLFVGVNVLVWTWALGQRSFDPDLLYFSQNLVRPPSVVFMGEAWSLSVEEWFYVTMPLALVLATALPISRRWSLLGGIGLYLAAFTAVRLSALQGPVVNWGAEIRMVVIHRLDSIGYGVLVAYACHFHPAAVRRLAGWAASLGAALVVFVGWRKLRVYDVGGLSPFDGAWLLTINSAALASCLPWLAGLRPPGGWLQRAVEHLSLVSYSMYLSHASLVLPCAGWVVARDPRLVPVAVVMYGVGSVVLATVAHRWVERPILALRERLAPDAAAAGPAARGDGRAYTRSKAGA